MNPAVLLCFFTLCILICVLLAFKNNKTANLEQRIKILEDKILKKSRKEFVELSSVNSVLDTTNHCFYFIDEEGGYIVESEYRLENVSQEWWSSLSINDFEIVNKIK